MDPDQATGTAASQSSGSLGKLFFSRKSAPLALLVLVLHISLLTAALVNKSYLTDDSIQYLTLSQNMGQHGVFSQSYIPPYVPDLQRTPGYPVFLLICGNSIPLVLILQHLMVLLSGWVLYRIMRLFFRERIARTGIWIWLLQPYPILMASMVLSEVPFILFFLVGIYGVMKHLKERRLMDLGWGLVGLVLAIYIRPVALPVAIPIALVVMVAAVRSRKTESGWRRWAPVGLAVLLIPSLLSPWIVRNHGISDRWMVSSMGDMSMIHGRLGGLEAYRQGLGVGETELFRLGDSLGMKDLHGHREYYSEKQGHETELYRPGGGAMTIQYFLDHPIDGIAFQGKSFLNMLKGVGFGWSNQVTGNSAVAYILSGLQLLLNLVMYIGCLLALWRIRKWPPRFWIILGVVALLFLVSNAAWADGRYRMVIDPFLVMVGGMSGIFGHVRDLWDGKPA